MVKETKNCLFTVTLLLATTSFEKIQFSLSSTSHS